MTRICIPPRRRKTRCRVAPFAQPAHRRDQSPQRQRDLGQVEKPISLRCTSRSRPRRGGTQQAPSPYTRCAYSVKAAFAAGHPKTPHRREAALWCFRTSPAQRGMAPGTLKLAPSQRRRHEMRRGMNGTAHVYRSLGRCPGFSRGGPQTATHSAITRC